jgi:exodeoxyribonuclease VII small subunit
MPKSKEPSFEANLERLEAIVEQLETKEAPLEQALALYEEGVRLARSCQHRLEFARKRIEVLVKETGELKPLASESD